VKEGTSTVSSAKRLIIMPIQYFAIFLLVLLLVAGYLFLSHSIQQRRIRRQRLITALRARRNSFLELATGFPKGFLPLDLSNFLYRAIVDTCEQLSRIERDDPQHTEQMAFYTAQLNAQQANELQQRVRLDNPEQIKAARHLLQEFYKFIIQQSSLGLINKVQAEAYTDQIKRLVLQMTVDIHIFNARQSQQVGKIRLAIHYYGLARKLLQSEKAGPLYDKQIAQLDNVIIALEERAHSDTTTQASDLEHPQATTPIEGSKEWERFTEENEGWKKKNLYD
jgi:hypothetical protein